MNDGHFRFHDIRKSFGNRRLFAIDTIELQPGRCTALVGVNGAGKTTLLKIMAGLEPPQQAWVSHGDGPAQRWAQARHMLRRDVVYLHQFAYMFDATVEGNVGYGLSCAHVPRRDRQRRIVDALAVVGLGHMLTADARRLSGGERQRAALARALVLQPKLLLLDEPTASMDRKGREQTIKMLRQLKDGGLCTVVVTHDISTLGDLPDTCLQLKDGRLGLLPREEDESDVTPGVALPAWGISHG